MMSMVDSVEIKVGGIFYIDGEKVIILEMNEIGMLIYNCDKRAIGFAESVVKNWILIPEIIQEAQQ